MTIFLTLLALAVLTSTLVHYARHDRFAGPSNVGDRYDDLGPVAMRSRLVPRHS